MDEVTKDRYARAFGIALRESTPTAADRAEMILTEARLFQAHGKRSWPQSRPFILYLGKVSRRRPAS